MESDNRKTKVQLINELDAARRRLRELEKISIIEKCNDGIVIIRDGLIEFANAAASESYGFSKEDTYGKPFINCIAPKYRLQVAEFYRKRLLGENAPGTYETIIINKQGSMTPVEICASIIEHEGATATLAIVRDISQRKRTEDLLRESEEKFKTLAEKSPNMVFINQAGRIVYANQQCERIMGYSLKELYDPGFNFMDLVAPDDFEKTKSNFAKHAAGKDVKPAEYVFLTKSGKRIDSILSTKIIEYSGSAAILGVVTDITELKKTEQILKLQAELLDAESDAVYLFDFEGKFRYVNKAACLYHGYSREELLHMKVGDWDTPEDASLIASRLNEVLQNGCAVFELNHIHKNGSLIPVEVRCSLIKANGENLVLATARDVSERKKAESILKLQAELLDAESDAVYLHDLEGNLFYVNKAACIAHGYTKEELLKMNLHQLDVQEDGKRIGSRMTQTLQNGQAIFEVHHLHKNGTMTPVEVHSSLLELDGKTMILGAAHDISERKRMQAQLIMQDRLASIGQFISGIAHELNNPLTSVIGFSELLLQRELPGDISADLKIVNDEAKRTSTIIRNLLTYARQSPQNKASILINEPIQAVLQLRFNEQRVNNLTVSTNFTADLPRIRGNESQLQQVFFNLITNAEFAILEAHHTGTINIATAYKRDFIVVSIADDGPGIEPENMKRLFSPFFTTKAPGQGTGLGLSICQGIVTEHGGRIWAESKPGKGSTFFVELPVGE